MNTATITENPTHLLDVGILIALTNADHVHHARAHRWFRTVEIWATCPTTEAAFVRLMLNPAVAGTQRTSTEVLAALRALRNLPGHRFISDDSTLADAIINLSGLVGHRQVTDLHLLNLAAQHGATLATLDTKLSKALVDTDRSRVTLV